MNRSQRLRRLPPRLKTRNRRLLPPSPTKEPTPAPIGRRFFGFVFNKQVSLQRFILKLREKSPRALGRRFLCLTK
jgi:hypothetical protein